MTGQQLKQIMCVKTNAVQDELYYLYGGKTINDDTVLADLGIDGNSTIQTTRRLRGGKGSNGTAAQACLTCSCIKGCYHKAALYGDEPLPYIIPKKEESGYRMITWNRSLEKFLSSWKGIQKCEWDVIMLQEAGQWSDDCLKWLEGVTAHVNVMTPRRSHVRLTGRHNYEQHGITTEDQGIVTIFKKGQRVKLKTRDMSYVVSQVTDDGGAHLTIINVYMPVQSHNERGIPRNEDEINKLPEQTKARLLKVIRGVNAEIREAQSMRRPLIIAGDFNHQFQKDNLDATEPDKRGWILNQMFDGCFMYKNLLQTNDDGNKTYTFWRGHDTDVGGIGETEIDGFFHNEWAMASVQGKAKALELKGVKQRDHRPVMLQVDLKVMTQVREQSRKWRSHPTPQKWSAKEWVADEKEKMTQAIIRCIDNADSVRELYDGLQEVYRDKWPRITRGRCGTRLPGEHKRGRELKSALSAAIKAKDNEQQKLIRAQMKKDDEAWHAQRRNLVEDAAKKNQRFISESLNGEYRSQPKIYALANDDGKIVTSKEEVFEVLNDSWMKIMTANSTRQTEEFDKRFLKYVQPMETHKPVNCLKC
eukprot:gene4708-20114_t